MGFGEAKAGGLNKVFDDVVSSLEDLRQSIRRDVEEDALPQNKISNALQTMGILKKTLGSAPVGEEYVGHKRKVLEVINTMNDPALLTALGTMQTEFVGTLKAVQQMLYQANDPKRTKKVDLDRLRS